MFLSAQQIHAELEEEGTKVGLATVYRNLQSLAEEDLVDTVRSDDGEALYRLCTNEAIITTLTDLNPLFPQAPHQLYWFCLREHVFKGFSAP